MCLSYGRMKPGRFSLLISYLLLWLAGMNDDCDYATVATQEDFDAF